MKEFEEVYTAKVFPTAENDCGTLETYGKELQFVQDFINQHPDNIKYVWTIVEGDDSNLYITAGFHYVNRLNYLISIEPWKEESEVYIWCIFEEHDEEE